MNLSFWELDTYFSNVNFVIIGSGIVGLSTAYHLKQKYPSSRILILEKGMLPEGASTKNAGFACFGTLSEVLGYLKNHTREEVYTLIERRYKGLNKLRQLLGDDTIDYNNFGGYEIFRTEDRPLYETAKASIEAVNKWLYPVFNSKAYEISQADFGFSNTIGIIESKPEGQIDTGKMMQAFIKLVQAAGVRILNNVEVSDISDHHSGVELKLNNGFTFSARKVFLCTNAFTKKLYNLDVVPARAQVLITRPIHELKIKGCFHIDEGYYYFRNIGNRVLFGGARNLDMAGETTTEFGVTNQIQHQLEHYLKTIILPGQPFEIEHRWSGIMGMGSSRHPIIKQLSENVYCGVRLTGTGIAIGSLVGEELAGLLDD